MMLDVTTLFFSCCCYPTPSKAWWKTIEPHKSENIPGPEPEVVERKRFFKERVVQGVRSWTEQIEMRGVLSRITAGVA